MALFKRSLFDRMQPVQGTLDACDQSAARRYLSYVTRALDQSQKIHKNLYCCTEQSKLLDDVAEKGIVFTM